MLATGSNDNTGRFWTRNRPGDEMKDRYNAQMLPAQARQEAMLELLELQVCYVAFR
jgi:polyadenylation factor subunit 2